MLTGRFLGGNPDLSTIVPVVAKRTGEDMHGDDSGRKKVYLAPLTCLLPFFVDVFPLHVC